MAKIASNLKESRQIAPSPKPELAASKIGSVKIRLSFLTSQPKHQRSLFLAEQCGIQPPYHEDICILMPRLKVIALLENFIPQFEYLKESSVISKSATLQGFKLLEEDNLTLAYIF